MNPELDSKAPRVHTVSCLLNLEENIKGNSTGSSCAQPPNCEGDGNRKRWQVRDEQCHPRSCLTEVEFSSVRLWPGKFRMGRGETDCTFTCQTEATTGTSVVGNLGSFLGDI